MIGVLLADGMQSLRNQLSPRKISVMSHSLSDLTLEELWQLFPIFLVEHDQAWQQQYDEMSDTLSELPEHADMEEAASTLEQAGFTVMSSEGGRVSFNRDAYTAAKTDFIKAITARAKIDYLGRC